MAVVIILIIYIAVTGKKAKKSGNKPTPGAEQGAIVPSSGNTAADQDGINTNEPPINVGTSTFTVGQRIYAGQNTLNVYNSCNATPSSDNTIASFVNGDFIGTFLRKEGYCIVVAVPFGYNLFGFFVETSNENGYIFSNSNIYTK